MRSKGQQQGKDGTHSAVTDLTGGNVIGAPKTRADIQRETGLKGKELTNHLKNIVQGG